MANEPLRTLTPVGRLVQGHPMEPQPVMDDRTKQQKVGTDGKPLIQYYMALAFEKTNVEFGQLMQAMQQIAVRDWPQGQYNAPTFAWKIVDGDGRDKQGKAYADRPGFAGHYILKMSSGYPYQVVDHTGQRQIANPDEIKRGYFMRAYVSIKGNAPSPSPGLYVNVEFAQLIAYGPVIVTGPDVGAVLRAAAPLGALPAGASMTPPAPAAGPLPIPAGAMPGMPAQGGFPQQQMPMGGAPMGQPAMMPQTPGMQPQYAQQPGMPAGPFQQPGAPSAAVPGMMPQGAPMMSPSNQPAVAPHPGIMMPGQR